ncbi:tyrosine-type recombinase/integrase [Ferrovibrio terrae]|uniref:tyrosine-type recombinase/integrase n=1 Tax=Ferrovibrio terrae TaxID=2594003 RepID=UPI003137FF85
MTDKKIRHLVSKPNRDGTMRHYWQPTKALRDAGFHPVKLAGTLGEVIDQAEVWNAKVDDFYKGTTPAAAVKPDTVNWLIQQFQQTPEFKKLGARTRQDHIYYWGIIAAWCGDMPYKHLTRKAVKFWLRGIQKKSEAMAYHCYLSGSRLYKFAMGDFLLDLNPFGKMEIAAPAEREVVWSWDEIEIFRAQAVKMGRRSIALALTVAYWLSQREGDVITITWTKWTGLRFELTQRKTKTPIAVKAVDDLRHWLEETPRGDALQIVVSETTGAAYTADNFRKLVAEIRDAAGLRKELQFNDARRSGATTLGEAGCTEDEIRAITGHKDRKVLNRYVKVNPAMADNAMGKVERLHEHRLRAKAGGGQ